MEKDQKANIRVPQHNPVFWISAIITVALSSWAIIAPDSFSVTAAAAMKWLKNSCSWIYLWVVLGAVLFSLILALSPFGRTRLGGDEERPALKFGSWIAMLFAAGMGIGIVFWGISEPLSHYVSPMAGIQPMSEDAARFSIRSAFMHWGLHPWAIYCVVGMAMGYFGYRQHRRMLMSRTLKPLLGLAWRGPFGWVIDSYTVILAVVGVSASFGMGCLQISSGLNFMFNIPDKPSTWAIILIIVCIIYLPGSLTGVQRGLKWLSNANMILCIMLVVLAFAVGSHIDTLLIWAMGIADYVLNFFPDSLRMSSQGDPTWIRNWRVFYWAWWVSWAPFVGVFLARISRGRTIREFVLGTLMAPTLISTVWFSVLGNMGISVANLFTAGELSSMLGSPETALFLVFSKYPLASLLSIVAIFLLFAFFITTGSSATFVLSMQTSSGMQNPPANRQLFWGIFVAVVAFALIYSGGVSGIQNIAIVISFPFMFIMIVVCVSLVRALCLETHERREGIEHPVVIDDGGLDENCPPKYRAGTWQSIVTDALAAEAEAKAAAERAEKAQTELKQTERRATAARAYANKVERMRKSGEKRRSK